MVELNDIDKLSKEEFVKEFDYFCSRIDFGKSFLDSRSIQFMNRFNHFVNKL